MVTRNDVARAAGVSSAVVSYVLNDGPRPVSAAARARVLAAIDELGYRRNNIARFMRTRTTNSIGFVLPEIALAYFSVMTQRITEIAYARGLSVIVATSNGDVDVEREHLTDLASRQVDGVVLMSVNPAQDLAWAGDLGMPVLVVDRPVVAIESTVAAVEHLLAVGCRRLARLSADEEALTTRRRDKGWNQALAAHDTDPAQAPVVRVAGAESAAYDAARELLSTPDRPDGVVVDSPVHAAPILRAAADLGLSIPDDVAVVALEFGRAAEYTVPRLTSVDSPLEDIALRAVEIITAASPDERLLTLDGTDFTLVARESTARSR
ncbi:MULTISPECIES: LacI family DNA-binding transcriptional regulator [Microbacterium]|uniref:LacI family DNA-binding transcriptional regulator n=1 Tax=Microbacterium TaxID=33882 RepID=UPI000D65E63D|nr:MULTISPECIES: LacI family DNA-binding transcriptional regulator [Microbacterium]